MTKVVLKSVSKSFDNKKDVVKNINFEVNEGEFCVLVGPSGCGKTTILRMIAGLEDISGGELFFDNKLMNEIEPKQRDVGMVFQNYALYPHLTVFENIAFPLKIKKMNKNDIKKEVDSVIELLELNNNVKSKPKELSGGQRQRVALGRALVRKPKVFLFDEPLSNLDAKLRVQMRTEIISLQRKLGITSVYVTHDQIEAMTMADKLVVLNNGEINQIGKAEEVYNNPQNLFVAGFIGSPQINIFKGNISKEDGLYFNEAESAFKISLKETAGKMSSINTGKAFMAVRPENIHIKPNNNSNNISISTQIKNIEFIGNESFIYFEINKELKCLRTNETIHNKIGDKINLYFNPSKFLLFDSEGKRIN